MKIKTTILAVAAAVILSGCASIKTDPEHDRETISWNAFCAARGLVDRRTSTITRRRPVSRLDLGYAGFGIFIEGPRKWVRCIIPTRR